MKLLTDIRNYPQRSGTSQAQRYKPDLMGENVQLDERTLSDFILFAQRLSTHLTYYNLQNLPQGTWAAFLQNDITYHLADAAAGKANQWQQVWKELMENVEGAGGSTATDADFQRYFTWRFSFLYTLVGKLMKSYSSSIMLPAWKNDLQALFTNAHLVTLYFLLEKYYQASASLLLPDVSDFSYADMRLFSRQTVANELLQYGSEITSLLQENSPFLEDAAFLFGTAESVAEKVAAASEYLDEIATQLISLQNSVRLLAAKYLSETLEVYKTHTPHIGLFYAFLKLADEHRKEINGLLLKHLDFYYKNVLGVQPKSWKAPQAFVHFELAKNVADLFLPAGTLLQAGKDTQKKDVFYETLQDITVTKTEVADVRSFTLLQNASVTDTNVRTRLGWYGSVVANSADGKGAALQQGQSWNAYSNTPENAQQIGIAFYSELFQQANGENRIFEIRLQLQTAGQHTNAATFINKYGSIKIETDKEPKIFDVSASVVSGYVKISFTVSGIKNVSKASPNASLIFGHKLESVVASTMDVVEMFQTERIVNLQILISSYVVKVNNVETAAGTLDVSSAFPAFGGIPKSGSTFSVVAPLLQKKIASFLSLIIYWGTSTERSFKVSISFAGKTITDYTIPKGQEQTTIPLLVNNETANFSNDSIFVKLLDDLGHTTYANDMTEAILRYQDEDDSDGTGFGKAIESNFYRRQNRWRRQIQVGAHSKTLDLPETPYTPIIKTLEISGTFQESTIANGAQQQAVYNQYPYGIKKITGISSVYLLPSFPINVQSYNSFSEGELYIGLKNTTPGERVYLLFELEESSANPALQNPTVNWSYLWGDGWNTLSNANLEDGTRNLIQSGVVSFQLPYTDLTTHQILPTGLCWIKAAVPYNQTSSAASIISIHTQAVLTQFTNRNNDVVYLGSNVPAGTINSLFPKQAAIKKVQQPYASFGGQQLEVPEKLYTRTSERLRHKGRGVTAWDYETIILEQFPDIYKVKVLHHACPYAGSGGNIEKVVAKAGSVLVLIMPKTNERTILYKPLLSKARLTEVYHFVRPLASPFTSLSVMNPLFETINIDLHAYFMQSVKDREVYEKRLKDDLQKYLSPWAFDSSTEPSFGGVIYRNAIVDFVESLPYVDYVQQIRFTGLTAGASPDNVQASSPASVLISGSMDGVHGYLQVPSSQNLNTPTIAFC